MPNTGSTMGTCHVSSAHWAIPVAPSGWPLEISPPLYTHEIGKQHFTGVSVCTHARTHACMHTHTHARTHTRMHTPWIDDIFSSICVVTVVNHFASLTFCTQSLGRGEREVEEGGGRERRMEREGGGREEGGREEERKGRREEKRREGGREGGRITSAS